MGAASDGLGGLIDVVVADEGLSGVVRVDLNGSVAAQRSCGLAHHGFDAGVGFVSVRDPGERFTYTVLNNKSRGAWPVSQRLDELVAAST